MGKMPFYLLFSYRIIKIWDKDTLSLQASLHGHEDFIVDMSVSMCNKYLASASKDG
jgi:WD40 repeat protein